MISLFPRSRSRVLEPFWKIARCGKIILTRNPIESYVSWKIAQENGAVELNKREEPDDRSGDLRCGGVRGPCRALQAFQMKLLHGLQVTGQTAFYIDYDDINDMTC